MSRGSRRNTIDGQFAARTIDMLRSPALRVLGLSARRILERVEIELADHGGTDNGKLPVTFDDFESFGIHRHAIRRAIDEACALGFLQVTERGRAGNAEWRSPNLFRLTFKPTKNAAPTDDWKRIATVEEAEAIARAARTAPSRKTKPQWRSMPILSGGNRHQKPRFHSAPTATTSHNAPTATTFDISGEGG